MVRASRHYIPGGRGLGIKAISREIGGEEGIYREDEDNVGSKTTKKPWKRKGQGGNPLGVLQYCNFLVLQGTGFQLSF